MSLRTLPFYAHLEELRHRLIVCMVTLAVTFAVCYPLADHIVAVLFYPIREAFPPGTTMVFTALTEGFMTYLKVAFWTAVLLTTPMLFYQIWKFISPGLYDREKKASRTFAFWGALLFLGGGLFGYSVIMPVALSITFGYADQGLEALPRLQNYALFALKTTLIFGLLFEIPFFMVFATRSGLVSEGFFRRYRRVSYIALYVGAVILVPTDIFSQLLLFLPLAGLYEIGLRLSRWLGLGAQPPNLDAT